MEWEDTIDRYDKTWIQTGLIAPYMPAGGHVRQDQLKGEYLESVA
jgi:hypothetical protein